MSPRSTETWPSFLYVSPVSQRLGIDHLYGQPAVILYKDEYVPDGVYTLRGSENDVPGGVALFRIQVLEGGDGVELGGHLAFSEPRSSSRRRSGLVPVRRYREGHEPDAVRDGLACPPACGFSLIRGDWPGRTVAAALPVNALSPAMISGAVRRRALAPGALQHECD